MEDQYRFELTAKNIYMSIIFFFLSISLSRLFAMIPFFGSFFMFGGLTLGLLFLLDSQKKVIRPVPVTMVAGFFLEIYRVRLEYLQEMYEFLILSLLALVTYASRRR